MLRPFDFQLRTRVVFGDGSFARLGELARELSFTTTLIVADPGIVAAGLVGRAAASLDAAAIRSFSFHGFDANPDSLTVEAGRVYAASCGGIDSPIDSIVAVSCLATAADQRFSLSLRAAGTLIFFPPAGAVEVGFPGAGAAGFSFF